MDGVYAWGNTGRELLIKCFGSDSSNVLEYVSAGTNSWPEQDSSEAWDTLHAKTLNYKLKIIESCIDQLQIEVETAKAQSVPSRRSELELGAGIFLAHGQNDGERERVARFLERLELKVTILQEQADRNRTVIQKFLDHSSDVGFAVVLLTADDRGGPKSSKYEEQKFRARQNVWLELGFFLGRLGQSRVCALYEEGVEIPSDYSGVLFTLLDKHGAWQLKLAKEIKAAGIILDLNRAV